MFHETPLTFPVNRCWSKKGIVLSRKALDLLHTELIPFYTEISIPQKQDIFVFIFYALYHMCWPDDGQKGRNMSPY